MSKFEDAGDGPDCSGFWADFDTAYGDVVSDPALRPAESAFPDLYGAEAFAADPSAYAPADDYAETGIYRRVETADSAAEQGTVSHDTPPEQAADPAVRTTSETVIQEFLDGFNNGRSE
jgi:hypothetical protein